MPIKFKIISYIIEPKTGSIKISFSVYNFSDNLLESDVLWVGANSSYGDIVGRITDMIYDTYQMSLGGKKQFLDNIIQVQREFII